MNIKTMVRALKERFPERIVSVDSHTAGEPTRLIVGGFGDVPGNTMKDKLFYFKDRLDDVRLSLTRDPRGHRGIMAAAVTGPVSPGAAFGMIYMDARRYPYLCGHATIGAVATLMEAGEVPYEGPDTEVVVDTPSGPMKTLATMSGGKVESVKINMVPSFVYKSDERLSVPGLGTVEAATVCVGGFFVMVSAREIGMRLIPENSRKLIELGMQMIDSANAQLTVRHPLRPEVSTVDVTEFYDPLESGVKRGKSAVIYGESHMDHSPCGTGTAARLTLMHHRGELEAGEPYISEGPLGTTFAARIVNKTKIGDLDAVEVEIEGTAYITGIHEFIRDPADPAAEGYML